MSSKQEKLSQEHRTSHSETHEKNGYCRWKKERQGANHNSSQLSHWHWYIMVVTAHIGINAQTVPHLLHVTTSSLRCNNTGQLASWINWLHWEQDRLPYKLTHIFTLKTCSSSHSPNVILCPHSHSFAPPVPDSTSPSMVLLTIQYGSADQLIWQPLQDKMYNLYVGCIALSRCGLTWRVYFSCLLAMVFFSEGVHSSVLVNAVVGSVVFAKYITYYGRHA